VSLQKPKPVCGTNKRQCTAVDREVKVRWGVILNERRRNNEIDTRIGKANTAGMKMNE